MIYKNTFQTTVSKDLMLWQISPYKFTGIPTNSIFYKGRCGIGGTTMEIDHKRHSIIVVPNVSAIKSKCTRYNEMLGVKGEGGISKAAKIKRIEQKLKTTNRFIKIMITTDSFECVIQAAQNIGRLDWLYLNFFVLLDECHAFITEVFRENITVPFKFFWEFKSKALISATPFEFSNPLFSQLDKHEIFINEKLDTIELIEVPRVEGIIKYILTRPDKFEGNVHVFYNSIAKLSDLIKGVINDIGEIDCTLYFSKSDDNIKKIDGIEHLYKEDPVDNSYTKFNFYTSKYCEAWDLIDSNATIILITDVHASHTKVGITNKGVQCIGRLREKANRIIHFTNHYDRATRRVLEYFRKKHDHYAKDALYMYNIHGVRSKEKGLKPFKKFGEAAESYGEMSEDLYSVKIDHIKIDRLVNSDNCNEEYNNMKFIKQAWEQSGYDVIQKRVRPVTIPSVNSLRVSEQIKLAIEMIDDLEQNKNTLLFKGDYDDEKKTIISFNKNFELAFKAYYQLGLTIVKDLGYDKSKLKNALQNHANGLSKAKILEVVKQEFDIGLFYTNAVIKATLQIIYNQIGYQKQAVGTDLDEYAYMDRIKTGVRISSFKKLIN